jgi:osmoprotectant transport system permease protein
MSTLADSGIGFSQVGSYLTDSTHWWGQSGLLIELRSHVYYTLIGVGLALLIALPVGLLIGHTGRGAGVVGGLANGLRAVPALGFVVLLVLWLGPKVGHYSTAVPGLLGIVPYFVAIEVVMIVLAIPPILTNTYAGVQNVDPAVRDAAKGMGMTGWQVLLRVEFPIALPLIMSGIRSATLQVIATVIIAGYVPFGGSLGAPIIAGDQVDPTIGYPEMVSAAILVAALAIFADLTLNVLQRRLVSPGLRRTASGRRRRLPSARPAPVTANAS